jgi:hypothetical protein
MNKRLRGSYKTGDLFMPGPALRFQGKNLLERERGPVYHSTIL